MKFHYFPMCHSETTGSILYIICWNSPYAVNMPTAMFISSMIASLYSHVGEQNYDKTEQHNQYMARNFEWMTIMLRNMR
jgi:hypothetical protein